VNRCCAVVEFAIYPEKDKPVTISLDSFTLRFIGNETAAKPSSAKVVSATLQRRAQEQRDVSVSPTVGVDYGSGSVYDPATGTQRRGGVYTTAGVGVGLGSQGNEPGSSEIWKLSSARKAWWKAQWPLLLLGIFIFRFPERRRGRTGWNTYSTGRT
jgi:hypothetical protein